MVTAVSGTPHPKGDAPKKAIRTPLLPNSEADNGVFGNRRPKSREVTSRYMSSTTSSSTTSGSATSSNSSYSNSPSLRRYPSPLVLKTAPSTPMPDSSTAVVKRSQSVDRRRPMTPWPSTPGNSAAASLLVSSKRSLSVSFQGDSVSLPISKTKPAPSPATATNGLSSAMKGTPERRRVMPVRDQTENSKPNDQHRWPGRSREVNSITRSLDCAGDKKKMGGSGSIVRALHQSVIVDGSKASFDGRLKVQAANTEYDANSAAGSTSSSDPVASDSESISSRTSGAVPECEGVAQVRGGPRGIVVPARFWQETTNRVRRLQESKSPGSNYNGLKPGAPSKLNTLKKSSIDNPNSSPRGVWSSRGFSSPIHGAVRPSSPNKLVTSSASSPSRGMLSPSRVRNGVAPITLSNDLSRTPSILSFAAETRRVGKVGENRVVDAHLLRLLHNRHLQWRFINARADAARLVQKVTAEKSLYNAWVTTAKLWHSVKTKRLELQLLRRNLKLHSILKGQMVYLDDWDLIDLDHSTLLSGATEALEASTVRLPVVSGARVDIQNVKDAICSAVDVMQGMASSICSLLTKVDQVNSVASELANVTAEERALLDQCKGLLSTLKAMQVKECSMRTHILQLTNVPSSLTTKPVEEPMVLRKY